MGGIVRSLTKIHCDFAGKQRKEGGVKSFNNSSQLSNGVMFAKKSYLLLERFPRYIPHRKNPTSLPPHIWKISFILNVLNFAGKKFRSNFLGIIKYHFANILSNSQLYSSFYWYSCDVETQIWAISLFWKILWLDTPLFYVT